MTQLFYKNRKKSLHDERLLKILRKEFEVIEMYKDFSNKFIQKPKLEDICLFGPLTDVWLEKDLGETQANVVGLSWGYDLNSEITDPKLFRVVERNLGYCEKVIVDSEISEEILKSKFGFKGQVLNIPYGCDVELFASLRREIYTENNIAILRNWSDLHNNLFILNGLTALTVPYSGIVNIGGEGEQKLSIIDSFLKQHPSLNLRIFESDFISYCQAISNSGIYISASGVDGTSVTLLEAMSSSLICIVPDIPTNKKWIIDGANGFTYRVNEIKDFVEKMEYVLRLDQLERKKISDKALETVRNRGNWNNNKYRFLEFIHAGAKK